MGALCHSLRNQTDHPTNNTADLSEFPRIIYLMSGLEVHARTLAMRLRGVLRPAYGVYHSDIAGSTIPTRIRRVARECVSQSVTPFPLPLLPLIGPPTQLNHRTFRRSPTGNIDRSPRAVSHRDAKQAHQPGDRTRFWPADPLRRSTSGCDTARTRSRKAPGKPHSLLRRAAGANVTVG